METQRHEIGMIGLGVMGRNMLLNMADHGFPVAGYDNEPSKVEALQKESAENDNIHGVANIKGNLMPDPVESAGRPKGGDS